MGDKAYLIIIIIVLIAWCPWLKKDQAATLIDERYQKVQASLHDGCSITPHQETLKKIVFGYEEIVSYKCTLGTEVVTEGDTTAYATFFYTVLNMPQPLIR